MTRKSARLGWKIKRPYCLTVIVFGEGSEALRIFPAIFLAYSLPAPFYRVCQVNMTRLRRWLFLRPRDVPRTRFGFTSHVLRRETNSTFPTQYRNEDVSSTTLSESRIRFSAYSCKNLDGNIITALVRCKFEWFLYKFFFNLKRKKK